MKSFLATSTMLASLVMMGCFMAPEESTRQQAVPEAEVDALRLNNEGLRYVARGRYVDGEFRFRQALWLQPRAERILLNLGTSLFLQERFEESLVIFRDLFAQDPLNLTYRLWLGKIYTEQRQFDKAKQFFIEGLTEAETREDRAAMVAYSRSLANLATRMGDIEDSLCYSIYAYQVSGSMDEGLKHISLLLQYGQAYAAQTWFTQILPAGGDGSLDYHLRQVETALLNEDLDMAKEHMAASLKGQPRDAQDVFDRTLLSILVGKLLQQRGETVELSVLDNSKEVEAVLRDERTLRGPLAPLALRLAK
jgi:tetratricopeptide (TPR) repeat protein